MCGLGLAKLVEDPNHNSPTAAVIETPRGLIVLEYVTDQYYHVHDGMEAWGSALRNGSNAKIPAH